MGLSKEKLERLHAMGGRVTTVAEFLGETPAETSYNEMSLRLAYLLHDERKARGLTQQQMADLLNLKQSYVVRLEAAQTTLDATIKALLRLGVTIERIGEIVAGAESIEPEAAVTTHVRKTSASRGARRQPKPARQAEPVAA